MYELTIGSKYSFFSVSSEHQFDYNLNSQIPQSQIYDYSFNLVQDHDKFQQQTNKQLNHQNITNEISKTVNYCDNDQFVSKNIPNPIDHFQSRIDEYTIPPKISKTCNIIDLTSEDVKNHSSWSLDLYNHTLSRTLDKQKFVSPATLIGKSAIGYGHYNYSYFNNQEPEIPEVFDYSKSTKYAHANINNTNNNLHNDYHKNTSQLTPINPVLNKHPSKIDLDRGNVHSKFFNSSFNQGKVIPIDNLFNRQKIEKCVIILRGLPGSGKSEFCQAFKEKELKMDHSAPRILSLDHFFMEEGHFEYDPLLEAAYREELFKSFKRQVDEGYFTMIILDCVNEKISHFEHFYNYANINLFDVSILEFKAPATICAKRSEKKYDSKQIFRMAKFWEELPNYFNKLEATSFLQDSTIKDVEMEDADFSENTRVEEISSDGDDDDDIMPTGFFKSKWDEDIEDIKDRLDGMKNVSHENVDIETKEYLQNEMDHFSAYSLPDEGKDKKKKVKWADTEELKRHQRRKQMGFVAGVTDWTKLMSTDIDVAEQALVQIRYYEKD